MWESLHDSPAGMSLNELVEECERREYIKTFTKRFSPDDLPILLPTSVLYHLAKMKQDEIVKVEL